MEQEQKNDHKYILYLLGYLILGTFYFIPQGFMIPLGGMTGAIRIYQFYKKDKSFKWRLRLAMLVAGILLGAGILPISFVLPFKLTW